MTRKALIGIGILLVAFGAYIAFQSMQAPVSTPSLQPVGLTDTGNQTGKEFLTLLVNLQSIKLDDAIFSDAVFASLSDFSVALAPQPKGRSNPFAPLGM